MGGLFEFVTGLVGALMAAALAVFSQAMPQDDAAQHEVRRVSHQPAQAEASSAKTSLTPPKTRDC
ncbi:hypothetical protein Q0812_02165 [Brevundimonas sp. 2R-24]|uniref:Uncharacterized protein n=1 Tax=Peiella sedimenti TaxID=3061083 RepID=A0ABT8SI33_9CAUL|nr:hypothetical protein [Caulobacteraceae bacterium XZ-24]